MVDERGRYDRKLRRLRRGARRWSVVAGVLGGATAVLAPYAGLSVIDAFWAAATGGSIVLAGWRWADYRALALQPAPTIGVGRPRVEAFLSGLPFGRQVISGLRRQADRQRIRGSAVAPAWHRLDRATAVLDNLALHPGGYAETAVLEAAAAEPGLRQLGKRAAGIERGLPYAGSRDTGSRETVDLSLATLVNQFEQGVSAYEELVGAAVTCVAEEGRLTMDHQSLSRLTEATDHLRGMALGFAELRPDDRLLA
jgi:hypothetical protein